MWDAFITGLLSNTIHQRLLENTTLDLSTMFTQARTLDAAQRNSESYNSSNHQSPTTATTLSLPQQAPWHQCTSSEEVTERVFAAASVAKCFFCGYTSIPARSALPRKRCLTSARKRGILPRSAGPTQPVARLEVVVLRSCVLP